ncbi:MAG: ATP-binding cassette domain-containing protein, partial [Pseudomonadales bacterium]|nr:ATP-binding cassette domain-containing protein [Pseudomonadales bacterium]
ITVMMVLAARDVVAGNMTLGDLVLVNAFMIQLFIPLNSLGFVYREIKASLADTATMFALLDQQPKVKDRPDAKTLGSGSLPIEFKNVSFHYHKERPIIRDVSFKIAAGEKVAIVGRSGSGKSTLARLLFRFYDICDGEISVDGTDIRDLSQHSLRQQIGVVPQDTVLFNDSIYHNIQYGLPDSSEQQVKQAIDFAQLSSFIDKLPAGWDTRVGERGLKVSGGEKQRIAIARVVLKNPQILIFDEATSSLDSKAERAISDALSNVAKNHTTLVIAHRLSTVVDADRILVLEDGEIVEQGDHNTLLQKNGVYSQLWEMQKSDAS